MDLSKAALLREVVAQTELGTATTRFAHAVPRALGAAGRLLPAASAQPWLDLHAPNLATAATTLVRETTVGFELSQHLVSLAVADDDISPTGWRARLRTLIERLGGEES